MKTNLLKFGAIAALGVALATPAQADSRHRDEVRDAAYLAVALGITGAALHQVHWADYGYYDRRGFWHYYDYPRRYHHGHRKHSRHYKKHRHAQRHHHYHHGHKYRDRKLDRRHDRHHDRKRDRRDRRDRYRH